MKNIAEHFSWVKRSDSQMHLLSHEDLALLLGYLHFLESKTGTKLSNVPVEIRIEGWKAYVLMPLEYSLYGSAGITEISWTHDENWAKTRFLQEPAEHEPQGDFGILGQWLGSSKFFTATPLRQGITKQEAIDLLGLRGYQVFDKPGPLYIIKARLQPEILEELQLKVVLIYKLRDEIQPGNFKWRMQDHFIDGSIPGYTKGGIAEVVGKTIQLENVRSKKDLEDHGISVLILDDAGG